MAKRNMTLAIAIVFALVGLLPAWGQTGTIVWTTVANLEWGVNPDGSVSTTEFNFVNRDAVVHTVNFSITDANGAMLGAMVQCLSNSAPPASTGAGSEYNLPPFSATKFVMTAFTPTSAVSPMQVNVETRINDDGFPNVVGSARVVRVATGGDGSQSVGRTVSAISRLLPQATSRASNGSNVVALFDRADPTTVATTAGIAFGVPTVVGVSGNDTVLSLTNVGSVSANVTMTARPPALADPSVKWPTVQVSLAPGASLVQTVSQLFPAAAFPAGFSLPLLEGLTTVVSDQPIGLTAMALAENADGVTVPAAVNVFKLAATPAPQQ